MTFINISNLAVSAMNIFSCFLQPQGGVEQLVEALRYKPEGRGFDSRWCHNPSVRTKPLGQTQPLTEMSNSNISWGVKAAGASG